MIKKNELLDTVRTSLPGSNNESTATTAENLYFDIRLRHLLNIFVIFLSLISIIFEGFHTGAGCTSHDTVHPVSVLF